MKSRQTNPNSDLVDAAMAATGGVVIRSADAEAPLPPIPADEKLTPAEQAVLGRMMEYSRKGSMRPRTVSRQQWVEDFLTRGFTQIERLQFGRSPVRLRITAPERVDRRGRPQFYEVQSAIEIAYVERRHAALFGKRATAAAEAPPVVAVATPVQAEPTDVSAAEAVAVAAPGLGAAWIEEVEGELAGQSGPGDEAGGEAGALVEAVGAGLSEREAALAESALGLLPSEASPAQVALVRTRARRFATAFFRALDQRNIGRLLAVLERGDGLAAAGWEAFQHHGLQLAKGQRVELTPANIRAEVRRWCSDAEWAAFLSQRVSRRIDTRNEAREARVSTFDPNGADFHYEPGTVVTPRGEKTRIRANIEAIKLLKLLESENREATPDEKAVLAKFNGWGAHKGLFEDRSSEMEQYKEWHGDDWLTLIRARAKKVERDYGAAYAETSTEVRFMKWYDAYGKEAVEIRELLTREEWESAARSILNAHYTSEEVCHFLWQIAERAGFMGGKVIDPAVGASGRVIAAMPPELRAKSRCEAVDIDSISARMAKKLFPQTKVHECGFEEALIAPGSADLVITNVPFSEHGPGVQTGLGPVRFNLHNYFVAESMRKLKPGGLAILITSAYTMDASDDQRGEMAKMAELWGAVRLPSDAFRGNAGTEVVTDVMLLRKPDGTMQPNAESWAQVLPVTVPAEGVFTSDKPGAKPRDVALVNEYYQRHPEHVLGYHSLQGSMYGRAENGQYTVTSPKDAAPLAERLTQVLAKLPANIPNSSQRAAVIRDAAFAAVEEPEKLMATLEELPGALVVREGRLYEVQPSRELILPEWVQKGLAPSGTGGMAKAQQLAQDYVDLREKLASQISLDLNRVTTPDMSRSHREELKEAYDGFVKRHGSLCDNTKRLRSIAPRDPSLGSVLALEIAREDKADRKKRIITPMPILTERTLFPPEQTLRAETLEDAVLVSINQTGGIDVPLIADLLGKDDVAAISEQLARGGQAFRLPEDPEKMEAKTSYLSGDVVSKLERAKKAAESDPRFIVNVGALEAVAPAPVPWENIRVQLGATWVPESVISTFLAKVTGAYFDDRDRVFYSPRSQRWVAPTLDNKYSAQAQARYGTQRAKWADVVLSALNQKTMSIWDPVDEGGKILNVKATAEANARIEALKADWDAWLRQSPDAQAELTRRYNEVFNRVVVSDHDGNHLTFPGLAKGPGALVPRAYQKNAVARFLAKPAGVVAHGTGYGKTLTGILIAHESRRIGAARKPMIVCDSANYAQFVEAYRKAYPQDRILVADDANFSPAERENFKAMVAYGDWDCVLMSRTQFERIPVSTETEQRWLCQELDDLRYTFELMRQSGAKVEARRVEKKIEAKTQKLKEVLNEKAEKADRGLTWEQLGVDLLEVDECFPYQTLVDTDRGRLPIGRIVEERMRVRVRSVNLDTGAVEWKAAVNWHKMPVWQKLVTVRHQHGCFVCTESHMIWTQEGYVKARDLTSTHRLLVGSNGPARTTGLHHLRQEFHSEGEGCAGAGGAKLRLRLHDRGEKSSAPSSVSARHLCVVSKHLHADAIPAEATVLQHDVFSVLEESAPSHTITTACEWTPACRHKVDAGDEAKVETDHCPADEGREPDVDARSEGQDDRKIQGSHVLVSRRQWAADETSTQVSFGARLADRGCDRDASSLGALPIPSELLQGGYCESRNESSGRSRWAISSASEVALPRSEEGSDLEGSWVESVEVHQRASDAGCGFRDSPSDCVYDLEVEGNHNFFAEGVLVSNCHRHKKCGFPSAHEKIKGIDTGISARGRDLLMKARFIQDRRDGRGAIGLSGTPATNTMAEFWNMVRLFDPKTLEDFNVAFFDEFKSAFCVTQNQLEMNEANGAYRYVERLSKFVNGPALISFVRQGCDVQLDATKLGLKLPKHKSGEIEFCIVPITDAALDQMDALADIYRIYESKGDKRDYSWVPIMLMQCGMAASIDPRLVDPKAPDEESSLLNVLARNVAEIHHETTADKKTQCVFLDRYRRMDTSKLEKLRKGKFEEIKIEIDDTADPVDADPDDEGAQVAPEPEDRPEEFNLYRELKAKLIGQGVPTEEIAIISEAKTPKERAEMFERVNRGEIRVIMGSSDKLGIGANFQQKLYAAHHFDPPRNMTPDQMEQRDGRILRSGNTNEEIRNIYYGMQDTVTPAIYNRIQTKRKFIKQGLSASARDVEFEDTSEVRLEELKAALVTDKRQLQMAELIASIKDERMQIDVQESRIGTLRSRINYLEGALRSVTLDELPAAEREAAFIAKHIMPFDGKLRVDFSNIADGTSWKNPKVKEWIEKQGTMVHEGPAEEVEKKLRGLVDALKETEMPQSQMEIQLGRLIVNGAPVRITLNQVTFKSSGREALALLARVANPADSAKGSSYLSDATHFGSAEMLTRTVAYAVRSAAERPASLQTKADSIRHDLKAVMAESEQMAMPTRERLQSLEVAKKALEEDMAKNPYVRGADRRKPSLAVAAAAGMSTVTAAPTMQTPPVKARS